MSSPDIPRPQAPGSGVSRRFRMGRTVMALVLREMSTRYGRSPGGYIWAILEPLGMILLMAVGFSLLLHTPPLGTSFVLFFATGFVPFTLYQEISLTVSRTINFSRALLTYPVVTWVDAILARLLLNTLTGVLVGYIIMAGVLSFSETRISIDIIAILQTMLMCISLGFAIGTLNCALIGLIPIWEKVWSIVTRPLFLASGVIFLYEDMPEAAQDILWYNPLIHIIAHMRTGIYPTYEASYFEPLFVVSVTLVILFFGIVLMGRYHREILNA